MSKFALFMKQNKEQKNKIMIVGAGVYQVPLIQRAKERGLETIVVSPDGNYPGLAIADKVEKVRR